MADGDGKKDKVDAIKSTKATIKILEKQLDSLNRLFKSKTDTTDRLKIMQRIKRTSSELFDQQTLLAHLSAQSVRVKPMSAEAKKILKFMLGRLDQFVKSDKTFHVALAIADGIVGLANDHEQEIKRLIV